MIDHDRLFKELIKTFYTMLAMVSIKEGKGGLYEVEWTNQAMGFQERKTMAFRSSCDEATIDVLGGKLQARKLLRHCQAAVFICAKEPSAFGVIASSFDAVATRYPILRGYYEQAKARTVFHAWWRHK